MNKKGFSLAEMMIIMLLLSIALAASMPIISRTAVKPKDPPGGTIFMWAGNTTAIPKGWQLCDGTNKTPDLRSRFIYGAGGSDATKDKVMTSGWGTAISQHWPVGSSGSEEMMTVLKTATGSNATTGVAVTTTTSKGIYVPRFYSLAYIMRLPARSSLTLASVPAPTPIVTTTAAKPTTPPAPAKQCQWVSYPEWHLVYHKDAYDAFCQCDASCVGTDPAHKDRSCYLSCFEKYNPFIYTNDPTMCKSSDGSQYQCSSMSYVCN